MIRNLPVMMRVPEKQLSTQGICPICKPRECSNIKMCLEHKCYQINTLKNLVADLTDEIQHLRAEVSFLKQEKNNC